MLNIDETKLQDLLQRRKKYIKTTVDVVSQFLVLVSFVTSVILSDFTKLPIVKIIVIGVVFLFYLFLFIMTIPNRYSIEGFYKDICSLQNGHNFSIFVFRDTSGNYPIHYLMKYDKRWNCFLFPYQKSTDDDKKSVSYSIETLFKITDYKITKTLEEDFTKVSVSANLTKTYHHTFYFIEFDASKYFRNKKTIKIFGDKYKWLTIDELKRDKRTMERNYDNISYVESHR